MTGRTVIKSNKGLDNQCQALYAIPTFTRDTNMTHPKAHKEKWTVHYLATGAVVRRHSEEDARILALEAGDTTPVSVIPPIYGGHFD
jgi:hypothetical protein